MSTSQRNYIYRIIHIDNLDYILSLGKITCPTHTEADPNYIGIGDQSLKESRRDKSIEISPFGTFSDYVAFYFGYRSPMLYNIKNGFLGAQKRPQNEIIYLVSSIEKVIELGLNYIFFDGHGYHNFSQVFNNVESLNSIDWEIINASQWFDTEEDPDRKRRKQAEFLIKNEMVNDTIIGIGAYDEEARIRVNNKLEDYSVDIKTVAIPEWYY